MNFLLGNLRLKLLAVAAAAALWATVAYSANPTQEKTFTVRGTEIQHTAVPAGLVLLKDLPGVSVTVVGSADAVASFDPHSSLRVLANLSGLHQGTLWVPVEVTNLDPAVQLRNPPTSVQATADQLATVTASVTLDQKSSIPPGFHEVSVVVEPKQVSIAGAKSLLAGIEAYVEVNLAGHQSFFEETPAVSVRDQTKRPVPGLAISPATVTVKVTVQADAVTETKVVAWSLTGQAASGYRVTSVTVTPLQVSVTGLAATLDTLTQIPCDPVDINGQSQDVIRTVALRLPAGVQDVSPKLVQIHVVIKPI